MSKEKHWIFTFGDGQKHEGYYVKIYGTCESARKEMFARYGNDWSFQYSEEEWAAWCEKAKQCGVPIEKELK